MKVMMIREIGWWITTAFWIVVSLVALVFWPDTTDRDPYRDRAGR